MKHMTYEVQVRITKEPARSLKAVLLPSVMAQRALVMMPVKMVAGIGQLSVSLQREKSFARGVAPSRDSAHHVRPTWVVTFSVEFRNGQKLKGGTATYREECSDHAGYQREEDDEQQPERGSLASGRLGICRSQGERAVAMLDGGDVADAVEEGNGEAESSCRNLLSQCAL